MNALELAIDDAIKSSGEQTKANKAYLEFLKANLIIPIEKTKNNEVKVLFIEENGMAFMPIFSSESYLKTWADPINDKIAVLKLSGVDLLQGIGDKVSLLFNINSEIYKIFNPEEINRMKNIIIKLFRR